MNATALLSRIPTHASAVVPHRKDTAELETIDMPFQAKCCYCRSSISGLCEPVVKKGTTWTAGSLVRHAPRVYPADIFSGVSRAP